MKSVNIKIYFDELLSNILSSIFRLVDSLPAHVFLVIFMLYSTMIILLFYIILK